MLRLGEALEALSVTLREVLDGETFRPDPPFLRLVGGARSKVVNTAPAGRLPWEVIDVEDETPMVRAVRPGWLVCHMLTSFLHLLVVALRAAAWSGLGGAAQRCQSGFWLLTAAPQLACGCSPDLADQLGRGPD